MRRLYFRIYVAVLASLALFAVLAAISWRLFGDFDRFGPRREFYAEAAARLLPPADANAGDQHAALEHWRQVSGYDLALFAPDGRLIADASDRNLMELPQEYAHPREHGARHGPFGIHEVELNDGRVLYVARPPRERTLLQRFSWLGALALIALTVGISAYPVVRRLTRGLERLNRSVEALGAGNLSARVPVQGPEEVARLAATFNRAAERIEMLVGANKTLLANASHELRSPLARLRMGVEALSGSAPAEVRDEVNRNVRELDQLIDELLLASRLDGQAVDHAEFELIDLVGLAAEECAREGADLTVPEAGAAVMGDPRLLRRLLRNLLENARRHGDGTPAEVVLRAREDRHLEIEVLDRGPGVAATERERIFEPFYRLPGVRERDGGAGLGLALVRQIAGRHGGTVACLARDGGGSCFRVTLPAAP